MKTEHTRFEKTDIKSLVRRLERLKRPKPVNETKRNKKVRKEGN